MVVALAGCTGEGKHYIIMNASSSRLDMGRELVYARDDLECIEFNPGGGVSGAVAMLQAYIVSLIPLLRFRVAAVLQQSRRRINLLLRRQLGRCLPPGSP